MLLTYIDPKGEHHAIEAIRASRGQVISITVLSQHPQGGLVKKDILVDGRGEYEGYIVMTTGFSIGSVAKYRAPEPLPLPVVRKVVREAPAAERRVVHRATPKRLIRRS